MRPEKRAQKFRTVDTSLSRSGYASDWSCHVWNLIQPIRSTTQVLVVTCHQCGICALVSQTLFGGETSGSVAKCKLFSRASFHVFFVFFLRPPSQNRAHFGMVWNISSPSTSYQTKSSLTVKTDDVTSGRTNLDLLGRFRGEWVNETGRLTLH